MSKDTYLQIRVSEADKELLQRNIDRDGYSTMSQWLIDAIRTVTLYRPPVVPVVDNDAGNSSVIVTGDISQSAK